MRERHVIAELSAYRDGVSRDPERIARHLEDCPGCAKHYRQLGALSEGLRGLPRPQRDPAFVSAVLDRVQAEEQARQERRWAWFAMPAGALAALAVAAGALFFALREEPAPQEWTLAEGIDRAWSDAEIVEAAAGLMLEGEDTDAFEPMVLPREANLFDEETASQLAVEELVLALAADVPAGAALESPWPRESVFSVVDEMAAAEQEQMTYVLEAYLQETRTRS